MAVLPFCPGLTVEIFVNGEPLPEYDGISDTSAAPNSITKYVEAKTDARFAHKFTFTDAFLFPSGDIRTSIYFDGDLICGKLTKTAELFMSNGHETSTRFSRVGDRRMKQDFLFEELVHWYVIDHIVMAMIIRH